MLRWSLVVFALLGLVALFGPLGAGSFGSAADAQVEPPGGVVMADPAAASAGGAVTTRDSSGGPEIVKVGFLVNNIQDIDLEHHRYQIDFYIWYQWSDPEFDPSKSMEFMNDAERWATMRAPAFEEPVQLEDGSFYFRERILSTFKRNLPLEDYPYDRPELQIVIEDAVLGTGELVFVPDDPPVEMSADLSVPGYDVGVPTVTVTDWEYRAMGAIDTGPTYSSRIVLTIPLNRPWLPYTAKIFIPLLIVVLCASIVFLIPPEHVDARFGLGISALLTLVALKWITDGELPLIDYLGLVDLLYLFAFIYVAVGLIETTYSTWQRGRGVDDAVLNRLSRTTLLVAGSVFLVSCIMTVVLFVI